MASWYRGRAGRTTDAPGLHELRPAQAQHLLEAGGFGTVAVMTEAGGFASAKHFGNVYAERFGRPPGDYRAAQE